jgi:hypothetical protein
MIVLAVLAGSVALLPGAGAHCDTLDGPVVADAKAALTSGSVAPVLKWVPARDEEAVRDAFGMALKVRALGPEARELADLHFFETVVRLHRESEGAPYKGLKPAGAIPEEIAAADRALREGTVDALAETLSHHVARELKARFERVRAAALHAEEDADKGRAYVAQYVRYVHYVEALVAAGQEAHHGHE